MGKLNMTYSYVYSTFSLFLTQYYQRQNVKVRFYNPRFLSIIARMVLIRALLHVLGLKHISFILKLLARWTMQGKFKEMMRGSKI